MQACFEIKEIKEMILEMRRESMKHDYIKRIYQEWKNDKDFNEKYILTLPHGCTHEPNTHEVKWSLSLDDRPDVPLVITEYVKRDNSYDIIDFVVNDTHLTLKDECLFMEQHNWDNIDYFEYWNNFVVYQRDEKLQMLICELTQREKLNIHTSYNIQCAENRYDTYIHS